MQDRYLCRNKRLYNDKGQRLDNGEWIIGFYFNRVTQHYIKVLSNRNGIDVLRDHEIDPATLGQCTGLRDKNGMLIFEGDIVKYQVTRARRIVGIIVWEHSFFAVETADESGTYDLPERAGDIEVIGNIHDTPELLEVQP